MQLRSHKTKVLSALLIGTTLGWLNARAQNLTEPADKYQWLEDVSGERSMAWVNAENERSAKALDVGPVYTSLAETALKVLECPTRRRHLTEQAKTWAEQYT
jgi:prolyl oligopeptidase